MTETVKWFEKGKFKDVRVIKDNNEHGALVLDFCERNGYYYDFYKSEKGDGLVAIKRGKIC